MTIDGIVVIAFFVYAFFSIAQHMMPNAYGLALRIIRFIPKILLWFFAGKTQLFQSETRKKQRGAQRYTPKTRSKRR